MARRSTFLYNLSWLLASFVLAFLVWILATVQADPIAQQTLASVPVTIVTREGYTVIDTPRNPTVRVLVRGQQSAISLLTADDLSVRANLTDADIGQVTVPLTVTIGRRGIYAADTQPSQITVTIDQITTAQKPLEVNVTAAPPVDFAYDPPQADTLQVAVTGASSKVNQVVAVRAQLDLSNRRNPLDVVTPLVPVDAQGNRVNDVTVEPRTATVSVNIFAREDVRQLTIRPAIELDTLEPGHVLTSIGYEPQTLYVSGSAERLSQLPATIETTSIDLTGMTSDFSVDVEVELPDDVVILSGSSTVTVNLGISAQTTARQIDSVPIEVIGLSEGYSATLTPDLISIVISGPISIVNQISPLDVRAIVDLNGLPAGTQEITPRIIIQQGRVTLDTTLLPAAVTVTIVQTNGGTPNANGTP
jgi:YbbR domain-containing protein